MQLPSGGADRYGVIRWYIYQCGIIRPLQCFCQFLICWRQGDSSFVCILMLRICYCVDNGPLWGDTIGQINILSRRSVTVLFLRIFILFITLPWLEKMGAARCADNIIPGAYLQRFCAIPCALAGKICFALHFSGGAKTKYCHP